MSFSNVSSALPESMSSPARATPSRMVSALPPMYREAPALRSTALRLGPRSAPERMARTIWAFSAGVPPRSSSRVQRYRPKSSGAMV